MEAANADAPVAALINTFGRLAASGRTSAEFANHLAFLMLDLTDYDFQQVSRDYAHAVEVAIAHVPDASRAAGELDPSSIGEAHLARAIHASYNGALVTWGMTGEGHPSEEVTRVLSQLASTRPSASTDRTPAESNKSLHQAQDGSVTNLELPFLAYYTANGDKSYCDGKPPTATDKDWAQLYVQLTGNTTAVHQILTG